MHTLLSVLQDLRVLEQQQLESQRQLQSIKQAKTFKLEQKNICIKKLSLVKFSNGESKERTERARKVLSECSHILNDCRRAGDSFFGNLKHLDSRLKQVVHSLISLQAKRRQADCDMMAVRQTQIRVTRSKADLESRFYDAIRKRDGINDEEQRLTKAIQDEYAKTKAIADDTSGLRKLHSELEQALTCAQQASITSKSKIDCLSLEADDEKRRHLDTMRLEQSNLLRMQQVNENILQQIRHIRDGISEKSEESMELWSRFYALHPKYRDISRSIDAISESLTQERAKYESLEFRLVDDAALLRNFDVATIDLNLDILAPHEQLKDILKAAQGAYEGAHEIECHELLRKESNKLVLGELERKTSELLSVQKSCSEMEQQCQQETSSFHERRVLQSISMKGQKKLVDDSMLEIQHHSHLLEELKQMLQDEQVQMAMRQDELSIALTMKQATVDELHHLQKNLFSDSPDIDEVTEVMNVSHALDEEFQQIQKKIKERMRGTSCWMT